ncbi:hypothetical protein [Gemmatimonas sp.]|uniref:hypothetical protein n=1 Tax=Gemmatimonas sp. TaxID=1962908 RepID=UPI00286DDF60|nr:hypothetical protein [Gemmatimonas sp.]
MRILAILTVVALVACSKGDTPAVDSTAMTSTMAAAAAPLTAADVDGSWNGMSMGETSDSVTLRWTTKNIDGTTGTLMIEGQKDAITFTRTFDADSMIASSTPYANPADAKGPKLLFRSVGRLKDGKLVGTSANMLADKPDSVVSRGRFVATKAP